jgi:L-glutamine-phosphate cytidylyltransferase
MTVGIIIAAGRGLRMGPLTEEIPKCMLTIGGRPLLHHTIDRLRGAGCKEIVVIVGYKAEKISAPGCTIVENLMFDSNNILHSLMCAQDHLTDDVVCTYSDIWLEPEVVSELCKVDGDIVAAVDVDWQPYYEDRSDHPLAEAENAFFDGKNLISSIGKHLVPEDAIDLQCGEFLGLWRMNRAGAKQFVRLFEELDETLSAHSPFQNAKEWQKAYITDIFQEWIDRGGVLSTSLTRRQWAELDTRQDIERLPQIAERQHLRTLVK